MVWPIIYLVILGLFEWLHLTEAASASQRMTGVSGTRGKKRVRFGLEFGGFAEEFAGLLVILS
jgi:hypothetical protein